jgi:hypothetical protein
MGKEYKKKNSCYHHRKMKLLLRISHTTAVAYQDVAVLRGYICVSFLL